MGEGGRTEEIGVEIKLRFESRGNLVIKEREGAEWRQRINSKQMANVIRLWQSFLGR